MPNVAPTVILSCEHGGNAIPPELADCFAGQEAVLASHRGYDLGARALGERIAAILQVPLHLQTISRLVVDTNRSLYHPRLFSKWTGGLSPARKRDIVDRYYRPHREGVGAAVAAALESGAPVFHLAVHSFTPVLDGVSRKADVGLLYDPARPWERLLAAVWQNRFAAEWPALRVRKNYPYRGTADGLTTALRRVHGPNQYAGLELEVNQAFLRSRSGGFAGGTSGGGANSSSNSLGSRSSPAKK